MPGGGQLFHYSARGREYRTKQSSFSYLPDTSASGDLWGGLPPQYLGEFTHLKTGPWTSGVVCPHLKNSTFGPLKRDLWGSLWTGVHKLPQRSICLTFLQEKNPARRDRDLPAFNLRIPIADVQSGAQIRVARHGIRQPACHRRIAEIDQDQDTHRPLRDGIQS